MLIIMHILLFIFLKLAKLEHFHLSVSIKSYLSWLYDKLCAQLLKLEKSYIFYFTKKANTWFCHGSAFV